MRLSQPELLRAAHHLQVAASRYTGLSETATRPGLAETFRKQAADSLYLAALLTLEARAPDREAFG